MNMMCPAFPREAQRRRADALRAADRRERGLQGVAWVAAVCVVGGIHAGIVWYLLREQPKEMTSPAGIGAVMIDLAPKIQQALSQTDAAVAKPEAAAAPDEPPPPREMEEPEPAAKVEDAPVPAIAPLPPQPKEKPEPKKEKPVRRIEKPAEKRKPLPKPRPARKPSQAAAVRTASAPRLEQRASTTSAMTSGAANSPAAADWKSQVAAALNRNKRYPAGVQATGSPALRLTISASGQVSWASVVASSGSPELDRAAIDTIYRSSPLPPPPSGAMSLTFRMNFRTR